MPLLRCRRQVATPKKLDFVSRVASFVIREFHAASARPQLKVSFRFASFTRGGFTLMRINRLRGLNLERFYRALPLRLAQ